MKYMTWRVKAVMDNGEKVQDILMNREVTEAFTGITLDKAKEMATEVLDQAVRVDVIKSKLVGTYYVVTGARLERSTTVDDQAGCIADRRRPGRGYWQQLQRL